MPGGYEAEPMEPKEGNRLVVLLCGIPGCGKDAIGRSCAKSLGGSALSQDEHNGNAACTQSAFESMLAQQSSPIFVLRNGVDVGDRLPYVLAARRSGYRVTAVWPSEMKSPSHRAALFLASLAGCYGRLYDGGKSGHETLTVDGHLQKPAQVCLNFLQMFRAPSAPGEVDAVLSLSFLQSNLESTGKNISLTELGKGKVLPQAVQDVFDGDFDTVKTKMMAWGDIRRPVNDIANELVEWVTEQMTQKSTVTFSVSSVDTKKLQRAAKIRAAVEHLVSPYNLLQCRDGGATVKSCKWFMVTERLSPAWPLTYFIGAPQLKKWGTTEHDVQDAAEESCQALAALQDGDKGVRVQLLNEDGGPYVTPMEALPEACLRKLRCPDLQLAVAS